ncbi:MAG: DUF885 family protein [Chloroflexi bacterium]|nr:DUF885 family protein [Chloroflexota bacterium]
MAAGSDNLVRLGEEFWKWRAATQPQSGDDIPRIQRPAGWAPDWSPDAVAARRETLVDLEREWRAMATDAASGAWAIEQQVDYRLIGSALARVRWELDVLRGWQRNPHFYVHQTLGTIFEALLPPAPFSPERTAELIRRAEHIPATVDAARENLASDSVAPFARLAIAALEDVRGRLRTVADELGAVIRADDAVPLQRALAAAANALESFAEWLAARVDAMTADTAIGRARYDWFLTSVALLPLSPEEIVVSAQQELERSVVFEALEAQRNRDVPPLQLPGSRAEQIEREARGEAQLRAFCEDHDLLTFPAWLRRYRNLPLPAYLVPLHGLGVTDDLTSPSRLDEDGTSYIPEPRSDLPYFYLAMARDPRTLIAHEGMHYYQLARSWAHADPLRRFYYDSGPNEGIGFYAEEMLLQSGLFDDSPRSREIIYSFMRLRAVRVGVDVRLALGELTIETAARELAERVPMDPETAREEASFFASDPGQAISYHVGKMQIVSFLADVRRAAEGSFSLRAFHDRLWINGNVPIALQRWESLGDRNEVSRLDTARASLPM